MVKIDFCVSIHKGYSPRESSFINIFFHIIFIALFWLWNNVFNILLQSTYFIFFYCLFKCYKDNL